MAEKSGKSVPDDRQRSEKQIADLVPYVSGSAVDAVRDALFRIVVENREHSQILDLLLPKLEQMPSKRSEALDWLDDQLARLNDDEVISVMDRLKRVRGHELKLRRETQPVSRFRIPRRLWPLMGVAAAMFMMLTYAWASAAVSLRAEKRENQARLAQLTTDNEGLMSELAREGAKNEQVARQLEAYRVWRKANALFASGKLPDEAASLNQLERAWILIDEITRSILDEEKEENLKEQEQP